MRFRCSALLAARCGYALCLSRSWKLRPRIGAEIVMPSSQLRPFSNYASERIDSDYYRTSDSSTHQPNGYPPQQPYLQNNWHSQVNSPGYSSYDQLAYTGHSATPGYTPSASQPYNPWVQHQGPRSPSFQQVNQGYQNQYYPQNANVEHHTAGEVARFVGVLDELDKQLDDGDVKAAIEVLQLLIQKGVAVDAPRCFRLMQLCSENATVAEARSVHDLIGRGAVINFDVEFNNRILEMYARCGSMDDARKLFDDMPEWNVASWGVMVAGFADNGLGEEALSMFAEFKKMGLVPDGGMFVSIFSACSSLCAVDEGMLHFESMQKDFHVAPCVDHYMGVINMLGRCGNLDEALEFVEQMVDGQCVEVWEVLMNQARLYGHVELGDRCAGIVARLDPTRLSAQSTKEGLLPVSDAELAKEKQKRKASLGVARSRPHEYKAGDRSHPDTPKIYEQLRFLAAHMKEAGYIPDHRFVLHDIDPESKDEALLAHSERLALCYGLITSAARQPIRIIKNLRTCVDCHEFFKIVSKIVGRHIVSRDAKRFHHFEDGKCSCNDYW